MWKFFKHNAFWLLIFKNKKPLILESLSAQTFFSRKRIQKCRVVWCTPPCFGGSKVWLSGLQVLDHRLEIQFCFISVCARFYGRVVNFFVSAVSFFFLNTWPEQGSSKDRFLLTFSIAAICVCVSSRGIFSLTSLPGLSQAKLKRKNGDRPWITDRVAGHSCCLLFSTCPR